MIQGIDHLVIVVNDLDQAVKDYTALGFTVVPGGRHPVGSHNALISFQDGSYLEIIAFYRAASDHRWWEPLKKGERLVDFCFRTDDLRGDTRQLREAGVAINDPVPWSRKRPDGYELKWLLSLATGNHRGVAPFLIEDVTPRSERIPQEFQHSNGAVGIDAVTVAVSELGEIDKWYGALLGAKGATITAADLNAKGLSYTIGPHKIEFLVSHDGSSPLADWLHRFGPSPYSAVLKGNISKLETFDPRLTHGTHLFIK
jgi:catechol 2,3-dioxygenase-like lactoylglutathione lyase family enzyme